MNLKSFFLSLLLAFSPAQAILRGDDTQQLHQTRDRLRGEMDALDQGSDEYLLKKKEYHTVSHKLRALDFFEHGMTQEEYDEFSDLLDKKHELALRHEQRQDFDPEERKRFALVNKQVNQVLEKYKGLRQQKRDGSDEPDPDNMKIRQLRKRLAESEDRDEMEQIRHELAEIYEARPQLTKLGKQKFQQRTEAQRKRNRERKGIKAKFPKMSPDRMARVQALRKQIDETEDRDELFRLRQELKYERDQATVEDKAARSSKGGKRARKPTRDPRRE